MILFATEIPAQEFQRHEPVQLRIACFVHGSHATDTERFHHEEMIECPLYAYFLATCRTGDPRQRFCFCRVDSCPAAGAYLGGGITRHWAAIVTFTAQRAMK